MNRKWINKEISEILMQWRKTPATEKLKQIFSKLPINFRFNSGVLHRAIYCINKFKITDKTVIDTIKKQKQTISQQKPQKRLKIENINELESNKLLNLKCPYLIKECSFRYPVLNLPGYLPCFLFPQDLHFGQIYKCMNAIHNQGGGVIIIGRQVNGNYIKKGFTYDKIQKYLNYLQRDVCKTYLKSILYLGKDFENKQYIIYYDQRSNLVKDFPEQIKIKNKRDISISIETIKFFCEDTQEDQYVFKMSLLVQDKNDKNGKVLLRLFNQKQASNKQQKYSLYRFRNSNNGYTYKQEWKKVPIYQQIQKNFENKKIIRTHKSKLQDYCLGSIITKGKSFYQLIIFPKLLAKLEDYYCKKWGNWIEQFPKCYNDAQSTYYVLKYEIKQDYEQLKNKLAKQIENFNNTKLHKPIQNIQIQNNKLIRAKYAHNKIYMINCIEITAQKTQEQAKEAKEAKEAKLQPDFESLKGKVAKIIGNKDFIFKEITKEVFNQPREITKNELQKIRKLFKQLEIQIKQGDIHQSQRWLKLRFEQKRGAALFYILLTMAQKKLKFVLSQTNSNSAEESNQY